VEIRAFESVDAAVVFGDSFRLEILGQVLLCRRGQLTSQKPNAGAGHS
jgi:hypothetical protein